MSEIETHPLPAFLPSHAKLLMLGSFPPPKNRWNMDFYYPNFQNDMWRIFGSIFFADKNYFLDIEQKQFKEQLIRDFLNEKGIAIYDAAEQVIRLKGNASDQFLKIEKATDVMKILADLTQCQSIMTTGDKATDTLISVLPESTEKPTLHRSTSFQINNRKINLYRMPSSSRAYPLALDQKAKIYHNFFQEIGLLNH